MQSTLVLVTHDAELASLADTRLVLRDGRPVPPDDALRKAGTASAGARAMTFVVRMALREIRASWHRLLFFFVCIAVGVASIVAIRSVIQSVREGLTREARAMTGADVVVRSDRPIGEKVRSAVDKERASGRVGIVSEAVEIATMVRPPNTTTTRIVELRAVQSAFPLYGTMTLRDGQYSHALLQGHGTLVRPELLAQLNLRVGDDLQIGTQRFQIRGVIQNEPGRNLGAFSLGSRLFIDLADLPSTGLLSFGSRASYELLLQVPGPPPVPGRRDASTLLARDLGEAFVNDFVRARSYRQNEGRMTQNLTRAENYLSLVGLVVLILGGIGVSSVTRVFVQQKVRSIAILKCVGSTTRQVLSVYLAQVLLLGLAGSVLGVAIAGAALLVLPLFVGDLAALLQVEYGLTIAAVLQGIAVGMLVSVLFSVVPLLEIRNVKPSLLLRQDTSSTQRFDWLKWGVAVAVAASLVGVAAWQAGSLAVGLVLSGGFVAIAFVLHLAGAALVRAVQPLRHARSFALRQAVLRVARPGNQTRIILLAVGLGTFFILGVRALQANLLQDFSLQMGENSPDMFLMDIQAAQRDGVAALIDRENGDEAAPKLIPVLRARIVGVRGREVNLESFEDVRGRGGLSREFTVTYRSNLEANEKLVDGTWWEAGPADGHAGGVDRGRPSIAVPDSARRRDALRRPRPHRHRARRQLPRSGLPRLPRRRLHDRLQAGAVRHRSAYLHRRRARREGAGGARAHAGPARRQLSERVGHRSSRGARHDHRHRQQRHARGHRRRRPGAVERQPDSHRGGLDDEVPARLRSRDSEDARREQSSDCDDAARRVRRAGRDRRHGGRARGDRP